MTIVMGVVGLALVLVFGLLLFIASRPALFRLERSAEINAPTAVIFPLINDFHQWGQWSPWEKLDPNMKKTYDGPVAGVGAISAWAGNKKAGEGRMTILESVPGKQVVIKLEFFKPFAATNKTTFTLVPVGAGTRVSWVMEGKNGFVAKAFHVVVNMDKLVGKDFEKGLANLGSVAQSQVRLSV